MRDLIDVTGASGSVYRFNRLQEGRALSAMGGNYIYAREADGAVEIICAGEAENLNKDVHARWEQAVRDHAATGVFTRLNISDRVRQSEQADILKASVPAMNDPVEVADAGSAKSAPQGGSQPSL